MICGTGSFWFENEIEFWRERESGKEEVQFSERLGVVLAKVLMVVYSSHVFSGLPYVIYGYLHFTSLPNSKHFYRPFPNGCDRLSEWRIRDSTIHQSLFYFYWSFALSYLDWRCLWTHKLLPAYATVDRILYCHRVFCERPGNMRITIQIYLWGMHYRHYTEWTNVNSHTM